MKKTSTIFAALALLFASPALARHGHHHRPFHGARSARGTFNGGDRPHAWCGWFMRKIEGVADASYNLARNWAHWGQATSPHVGAVVVYPHHVAKIVGACHGGGCVMLSGNDGHAVRTRWRSLNGHIAIRDQK